MAKSIELLAPAGALANLKAAVASGADAVYLGLNKYSARAYATNFNMEYLKKAVQICKSNDVKVYLAANTLIKNSELSDFFSTLSQAYLLGIDAVIIQDPSFISIIKESFPGLKVHVSTQAGVMNSYHASLLKEADRINLARELSKENLLLIRKSFKKELEIFVHGALCVCASGSCLFSSFLGGRSGNRGKCAQPCRKAYKDSGFYLSTKELCLLDKIKEIQSFGIDSLKIEGRMRTPYYVATVTSLYRKALDDPSFKFTEELQKRLKSAYSREFTHGLLFSEEVFNRKDAQGKSAVRKEEYSVKVKDILLPTRKFSLHLPEIREKESQKQLLIRVYTKEDALAVDEYADIIYLDLFHPDFPELKLQLKKPLFAATPRIMFDSDLEKIRKKIEEIRPSGILAGNLGILGFNLGIPIHLDYNANCFNDYSLSYLHSLGVFPIISPELSIKELLEFKNRDFAVLVHGKIRLMTLAHQLDRPSISDEKGTFDINKIFNGSEILNQKELGLFNKCKPFLKSGITSFFIDTDTNAKEIASLYQAILEKKTVDSKALEKGYVLAWSRNGVE